MPSSSAPPPPPPPPSLLLFLSLSRPRPTLHLHSSPPNFFVRSFNTTTAARFRGSALVSAFSCAAALPGRRPRSSPRTRALPGVTVTSLSLTDPNNLHPQNPSPAVTTTRALFNQILHLALLYLEPALLHQVSCCYIIAHMPGALFFSSASSVQWTTGARRPRYHANPLPRLAIDTETCQSLHRTRQKAPFPVASVAIELWPCGMRCGGSSNHSEPTLLVPQTTKALVSLTRL